MASQVPDAIAWKVFFQRQHLAPWHISLVNFAMPLALWHARIIPNTNFQPPENQDLEVFATLYNFGSLDCT